MKKHLLAGVLVNLLLLLDLHGHAQDRPIAFKGALIYPVTGPAIEKGILIVQKGRILAVGDATTSIPSDAEVVDATGKVIIPGIVDTHSHIGGPEGGDNSNALNPEVRVLDAVNPSSNSFKKALAGGITTANIMPGSGHLMSGQTIYLKMRQSVDIEGMLEVNEKGVYGGMKMANGTNSMRGTNGFPGTRAKSAAMDRELFVKAVEYKKKMDSAIAKKDSTKMPERDLRMESLVEVLEGRRIVHFHTHKLNDILTVLRLKKEFGFRVVLHHVSEAWKVIDAIAAAGVPCSIINIDAPGGKLEAMNFSPKNGALLEKAGVPVAIHTDDPITDSRFLMRSAALSVREGMSRQKALEALTIAGARMLDLGSRIGSLEKGKDADFVILTGDPFSVYTHVEQTWVEGLKRYDRSIPSDKTFAVGGYKVYTPEGAQEDDDKDYEWSDER
ncbi:MAG: amidohydrolase [Sphingobacteriales bacterium 50-39]|nr:amidohydrolase family protein [Sphingobacteriales bacterium]OJW54700.1 MAG: amidohydrolase [Sphingobacteriales bacterium 50-39]